LLPSTERTTLSDSLAGLEAAHLTLLSEGGSDQSYAFRQSLVRELIYDTLSFARRRELHAQLATHLELVSGHDAMPPVELLAYHHRAAAQWLPAARYLIQSADRAREHYAYDQAGERYVQALECLEKVPTDQVRDIASLQAQVLQGQGDLALLRGDLTAAEAAYRELCSTGMEPDRDKSDVWLKLALVLVALGAAEEAERYARKAEHSAASTVLAWIHWRLESGQAGGWLEKARGTVRPGQDRLTESLSTLLVDMAGDWDAAQRAYLSLDHPVGAALAACRQGDRHLENGEVSLALDRYRQAAEIWEQENDATGLALAKYRLAEFHWRQDEIPAAQASLSEALALLDSNDTMLDEDRRLVMDALTAVELGDQRNWKPWRWQAYDDAFRISVLFQYLDRKAG
jgi:tetratricopeptide (TPR) repeat protein